MTPFIFAVCGYMIAVVVEEWLALLTWRMVYKEACKTETSFALFYARKNWNIRWIFMQIIQLAFCLGAVCVYLMR